LAGSSKSNGIPTPQTEAVDVRRIPTGTLVWNLFLSAQAEQGLAGAIRQFQEIKKQQKMVADPPQLAQMIEHFKIAEHERYTIAKEINARFRDLDMRRCETLGLELFDPKVEHLEPEDKG
jgi:hypothetical protein